MPFAQIGDIQLYYEIDGQGEDLLLIHGVTSFLPLWQYVRPLLREHFRLVLPELRGHGRSDKPKDQYLMENHAEDLVGLLDILKIEQCIVAGHSLGGFIAQQMALDAPERVRALILICSAPRVDEECAKAQTEPIMAAYGKPPKEAVEIKLKMIFYDSEKLRAIPGMMELLLKNEEQQQANFESHSLAKGGTLHFNSESRLSEIQVPTLIIQGTQDKTFPPRWGDYFYEKIPNAVLRVIDQTGHSIQLEQPDVLVKTIVEYLQKH